MSFIMYLSKVITPILLTLVVLYGIIERKNVFELFTKGIIDGANTVKNLFPTLFALLIAVSMLYSSGITNYISNILIKFFPILRELKKILPFVLLRPISGSSSTAIGTNLMKNYGVDSDIGILISLIMGSTETTIYVVSLYGSKVGKRNLKPALILGLMGDCICVISAIIYFKYIKIF